MYYDRSTITPHEKKAEELFLSGYNCAQSVFAAFSDMTGFSAEDSAKLAGALGGGMCGRRDTCGAVTGMLLVLGTLEGYSSPDDDAGKRELYRVGKELSDEFETLFGTTLCRELLRGFALSPIPSVRTGEYYKKRPCAAFCAVAAHLLDRYFEQNGKL